MSTRALPFCDCEPLRCRKPRPGYPLQLITVGDHVKKRRLDLGLTRKALAARLGVDPATVQNWEEGRRSRIEVRYYPALIEYLGYNPLPEPTTRGQAIARARMSRGLSRTCLAALTGVDVATIRRLEADRPGTARLPAAAVCQFLRLDSQW